MVLLILISLASLVVLCCLLALVYREVAERETQRLNATTNIRRMQRQTIRAMFAAARPDLTIEPIDDPSDGMADR
jgi:hypothetical protein